MSKRKSDEIEKPAEDPIFIMRTCSDCSPFCASWCTWYSGGVKYTGAGGRRGHHARRISDRYRQWSDSDSDEDSDSDLDSQSDKKEPTEPTKIGPGSDGCTVKQRVAFLCSMYQMAGKTGQGIFSDPKFLKTTFEGLLCDKDKTITFMLLYSCNKIMPECHALPRKHGIAEIEHRMGGLQKYRNVARKDVPGQVGDLEKDADEAQHFVLTRAQWKQLISKEGCVHCTLYMSLLTYRNKDSVDTEDLLNSIRSRTE